MLKFSYFKRTLQFRFQAGTSRGVLTQHPIYILKVFDSENPAIYGLGEASPLKGLSIDDHPDFEKYVKRVCQSFTEKKFKNRKEITSLILDKFTKKLPALRFGLETALLDLKNGGKRILFPNDFRLKNQPIPINGLIWMGAEEFMQRQIEQKLEDGFSCIKMKIGAIDFETELKLLQNIRAKFSADKITLRVDANGAFTPSEALNKLKKLAEFDLHSIEQPIQAGQLLALKNLCKNTPLPIALDEELIGIETSEEMQELLEYIEPQFIILKPTLVGGLEKSRQWIELAESLNIGWWMTSALESNIGLNAISQFTAEFSPTLPQGLGTGQLYENNYESPLMVKNGQIWYDLMKKWKL